MMVELPDDILRLAGQQPRLEGDKGQRMVGLYHCTWRRARLRIQAGRDIQPPPPAPGGGSPGG